MATPKLTLHDTANVTAMTSAQTVGKVPKKEESASAPETPMTEPRFVRSGPPQSAAGAEVQLMRREAFSERRVQRSHDELHQLDHGIILRHVQETASFPDGRLYTVSYNEYLLPPNGPTRRPEWQVGYTRATSAAATQREL